MNRPLVRTQRRGPVATVIMDNPATLNAMDDQMGPQLVRALEELAREPDTAAVVLSGAGGNFTGGGNLKKAGQYLAQHPGQGAGPVFGHYLRHVVRVIQALIGMPQPVLSAVEGASSGAGLAWMLASDLVICATDARILPGFLGVGLVPAAGATWHLPRLAGLARASEVFMLGRPLPPTRALELGLVHKLAPPGRALAETQGLAQKLSQGPRRALAATKRLLSAAARQGLGPQLEAERRAVMAAADDPEFARRLDRFLKRGAGKEG